MLVTCHSFLVTSSCSLLEVGTGFHPELTGHENVYLYGAILGMDRWEVTRKFDGILALAVASHLVPETEAGFAGTESKNYMDV